MLVRGHRSPLLIWIKVNPRMNKCSQAQKVWNKITYLFPNLNRATVRTDSKFYPTRYNLCDYWSMLGLKLISVSKRYHWSVYLPRFAKGCSQHLFKLIAPSNIFVTGISYINVWVVILIKLKLIIMVILLWNIEVRRCEVNSFPLRINGPVYIIHRVP